MKATELRIGNYVLNKIGGNIDSVDCISPSKEHGTLICQGYIPYGIINFFKPIELTKEWLENFGFKLNDCDNYCLPFDYLLNEEFTIIEDCWFFYIGARNRKIKYVHQLQNLHFALTGKELTLNK